MKDKEEIKKAKKVLHSKRKILEFEFGMKNAQSVEALTDALKVSVPSTIVLVDVKRIFLTVGSGMILLALSRIFTNAVFTCLEIGKTYTNPEELNGRVSIKQKILNVYENARSIPPYPSIQQYDAKIWALVEEEKLNSKDTIYVWNVGH